MDTATPRYQVLSKRDLVVGTIIALIMGTTFTLVSSGMSLIATFIPGLVFTWLTYAGMYATKTKLPNGSDFLPVFFALLAVQFLHFAEEYAAGFRIKFPVLYGGEPYSDKLFVVFNMISYFVFTVACILVFTKYFRFLLVPALFFIIYGAIGNAISHTWWSVQQHGYFPGLVTAQIYWVAGPLVLHRLLANRRAELAIIGAFALVMVPLLTILAAPGAVRN